MLELYHSGLTTCSKQVRHCLREKGLQYESRYVELWRYENLSPSYLKLNPNGVVPTLVHDGTPIINSFCINEYIEDAFPEPSLRPADPVERARMRYWAWTADEVHQPAARLTHANMLQKSVVADLSSAEQQRMLDSTPVPDKRERWRILTKGGYTPGDLSMRAIVHRVSEIDRSQLDRNKFPRMMDWWDRSMARPAAAYTYSGSTEETPKRPAKKSIAGIAEYRV